MPFSMIVGRDTQALSEIGVTKAAVERLRKIPLTELLPLCFIWQSAEFPDVFVQGHQHYGFYA